MAPRRKQTDLPEQEDPYASAHESEPELADEQPPQPSGPSTSRSPDILVQLSATLVAMRSDLDQERTARAESEARLNAKIERLLANSSAGNSAYGPRPHLYQLASVQNFPVHVLDSATVLSRPFLRQLPATISDEGVPRVLSPDTPLSRAIEQALASTSAGEGRAAQFSTALGFKYEAMTSETVEGAADMLNFTVNAALEELQQDDPDLAAVQEVLAGTVSYTAKWIKQLLATRRFEMGFYLMKGKSQAEAFAQRAFSTYGAVVDPSANTAVAHVLSIEAEAKARAAARSIERASQSQPQRRLHVSGATKHQAQPGRTHARPWKMADKGASSSREAAPAHK